MTALYHNFFKYKLHHVVFWLVYYVGWVLVYRNIYTHLGTLLLITFIYMVAHAGMYYTTQYILLPRILEGKILSSIMAFLLLSLLTSVVMFFLFRQIISSENMVGFKSIEFQFVVSILFSIIFMIGVMMGAKSILDRIRARRQAEKLTTERLLSELHFLKAQVNPHFLFNTINNVYVLISIDPEKASKTLLKLSELLRAQLYEFSEDQITIEQEIQYLENYIALERIRKSEKLQISVEKEGCLADFKIAPLLLIPFLENCFKHVSTPSQHESFIKVKFSYTEGVFKATFVNSAEASLQPRHEVGGIGLKNIKRRLELIYPDQYQLNIIRTNTTFEVNLTLSLQVHEVKVYSSRR